MSQQNQTTAVTNQSLLRMKQRGEKIVTLTAYDASFAAIMDQAGVDVVLVGDSLGMVVQGQGSTVPVTVEHMIYHTRAVSRGLKRALLIADMPFASYMTKEQAASEAARLMQQGHAHMVKLEGGMKLRDTVRFLVELGIPVCGHLGLLPQSVNQLGGYRVQGKDDADADRILNEAKVLENSGASVIVLECIPAALAKRIAGSLTIPVIGIGAGVDCDGQVLVCYDMLDITLGKRPKFSRNFMAEAGGNVQAAVKAYVDAVRGGTFPGPEHSF